MVPHPRSTADDKPFGQHPITVAILNDHELVVSGLAEMLYPFLPRVRVIDVRADTREGETVDIVLFDSFAAPADGEYWWHFIGQGWEPAYVVRYGWPSDAGRAAPSGAVVDVPKTLSGAALVSALEEIFTWGTYNHARVLAVEHAHEAAISTSGRRWPGQREGLTEREAEIVALIATGLSNVEVAEHVFLGVNTVKTHIRTAYRKMGVRDRSNAVLWAVDHGLRPRRR